MKKISLENLAMIVTNNCNLKCEHCLMGKKDYTNMKREVVEASLSQISYIDKLYLCGGEITLNNNTINYIFEYIINNNIVLNEVKALINGTIFNEKFLTSLNYINHYVSKVSIIDKPKKVSFYISSDEYHKSEMQRLNIYKNYLENIKKYQLSKHFSGLYNLSDKINKEEDINSIGVFRTIKTNPTMIYVTYVNDKNKYDRNGICKIGPVISINPQGLVTEINASIIDQNTIYNYGNVLDSSIESIAISKGKLVKPFLYDKKCQKELKLINSLHNY